MPRPSLAATHAALVWLVASLTCAACTRSAPPPPSSASTTTAPVPARIEDIARAAVSGRRVIFIGLDGADWSLLDGYMNRGVMPTLRRLVREGTSGTLATQHPPLSPLIWTSMMTGTSPLEHRVLDFLRVNPISHQREPITSDERRVPAIWNMATSAGRRVGALGLWATYPAEPVNGLLVSDRLFTFLYSETTPPPGTVYPASEEPWAREGLARTQAMIDFPEMRRFLPWLTETEFRASLAETDPYAHPVSALRRVLIETRLYDTLGREWLQRARPDLLVVYVQGTDSIGHVFAPYAPPRQASIAADDYARYKDVPERYFAEVDAMLARYVALAEASDSVLMLASDHGFQWGEGRPTSLSSAANTTAAKWHAEQGIYVLWGSGIAASDGHTVAGRVDQVCATLLALLGLPAGLGIAGPSLASTSTPTTDLDYRRWYVPTSPVGTASSAANARVDQDTVAKLQALGYIGASEARGRALGTRTAGSLNNEGLLLKAAGRIPEAIEAFDQALTVDPALASASWNLSDLLYARNEQLDKSDALLGRAFASGLPEGGRFLIGRAIAYQRNGQIDRSIALLNQAVAAKPEEADLWLFRGRYRVERGECTGAVTDFQQAARLDATNPAVFASKGLAEACAGDMPAARESFRKSLSLDPNQPKLREFLRGGQR